MTTKKTASTKKKNMLAKYNDKNTKGDLGNSGIKSAVDLVAGATLGAGIGAATGRLALPVGLLLIFGSHYMDEDSGVLRLAGSASIAYGIGKAITNQQLAETEAVNGITLAGETSKAKTRLTHFKNELFEAFFVNKLMGKDSDTSSTVGAIDLSTLDDFENQLIDEAMAFEQNAPIAIEANRSTEHSPNYQMSILDQPDISLI